MKYIVPKTDSELVKATVEVKPKRKYVRKAKKAALSSIVEAMGEGVKPAIETTYSDKDFKTIGGYFRAPIGIYNILKRNVIRGTNTLLLGPTGVGKTELAYSLGKELGLPVNIFDMGTMSDPIMGLVGTHVIKAVDGKTTSEFKKSRFSEIIQKPGIVVLDELSRASATANNLLFPCLDFRKELAMEYCFEDQTPVKVHPECVFIATANLGSQYTGTHKLDRALLDRFMLMEIEPLDSTRTKEVLKHHFKLLNDVQINKIVDCYIKINKAHEEFTISFNLSLRHLKLIGELVQDKFTIYDSFYVICKGIGGTEGLKTLEGILKSTK
jgi:MoxR-like ATPase